MYIYIYIYIYIYHKIVSFTNKMLNFMCSRAAEWFNWIMVKIQLSFKYSEFHVNYFAIFSLITTLSTDVTNSLQCKSIFSSDVTWRHAWRWCFKSILILVTTLVYDFWSFMQKVFLSGSYKISSLSVRHRLQDLCISFIFQDICEFSCFIFKFQYSFDSLVSCF